MINYIGTHGTSFKGLMAYLLHDKDQAPTSERVAWTETHNLATDDPEKAWRVMLGTAKCQQELKAEAGVGNTGRKSNRHVFHYSLSWSGKHDQGITKEEMIEAAKASMTYLGTYEGERLGKDKKTGKVKYAKRTQFADMHQAIIVAHTDTDNPHVHVVINRVHGEHGVMLPDHYEKEKLSAWALDYRTAQGKEHLCPQRVKNAAKKAQGIVTNNPRKPRNVYEQDQAIAEADPGSRKKALLEQQARRRRELKVKTEAMKTRQTEAVRSLEDQLVAAERSERAKSSETIKAKAAEIRAAYSPKIDALADRHAEERRGFNEAKGTAAGHVRNTWAAFKTKQWMTEIRTDPIHAMKYGFRLAVDSGLQQRDIEKHHARERGELNGKRTAEERAAAFGVRMDEGFRLDELRQKYYVERNDLILQHGMDQAKLKAEWTQLGQDRRAVVADDGYARRARVSPGDGHGSSGSGSARGGEADHDAGLTGEMSQAEAGDAPVVSDRISDIARELKAAEQQRQERQERQQDSGPTPDLDPGRES